MLAKQNLAIKFLKPLKGVTMNHRINFSAGPATLPLSVLEQAQADL